MLLISILIDLDQLSKNMYIVLQIILKIIVNSSLNKLGRKRYNSNKDIKDKFKEYWKDIRQGMKKLSINNRINHKFSIKLLKQKVCIK